MKKFDIYSKEELENLKEGGAILHNILLDVKKIFEIGKDCFDIDIYAEKLIKERGCEPVFKNYTPAGYKNAYKYTSCISINNEVTHGQPEKNKIIKDGDVISLDIGLRYKGLVLDSAISFGIGNISDQDKMMLQIGERALQIGIEKVRANIYVNDIGKAIEKYVRSSGFRVVPDLCGHGVGRKVHSEPLIPHVDFGKKGERLLEGMVIAIEPHVTNGNGNIYTEKNNEYTLYSKDKKKAVQFEHTVYIDKDKAIILT